MFDHLSSSQARVCSGMLHKLVQKYRSTHLLNPLLHIATPNTEVMSVLCYRAFNYCFSFQRYINARINLGIGN